MYPMKQNKPELLAPAGDLEKLKIAVFYGADAVYIGGAQYGLRAKARNFTLEQLKEGIEYAHDHGVKVYIAANIIAHNEDFDGMGEYFVTLQALGADALIIADPGVLAIAKQYVPTMELHLSTQANNTNYHSALFWHQQGVQRIVTARELSFDEIKMIREKTPSTLQIESFIHGAMCISYSGRCLLSNYMSGRDANKGACSHPCRWKYHLVEETRPGQYMPIEETSRGTYIYNSKDLCMLSYIPQLLDAGINSFKIEGRMKTPYYVGIITKVYREAIDDYCSDPALYHNKLNDYMEEVSKASHRKYTTGFYIQKPGGNEQVYDSNTYIRDYDFVGVVLQYDEKTKIATVEQRNKFSVGDEVEILTQKGPFIKTTITQLWDEEGNTIESAPHPQQIIKIPLEHRVQKNELIRKKIVSERA